MTSDLLLRHLRSFAAAPGADVSDRQLLDRFAAGRDPGAFEALVRRHAPLVLGVCRRVLRQEQDAEDAFQATFLVLAKKAADVGRHGSVAGWLHRVAYHAALRARAQSARRERRERQSAPRESPDPLEEVTGRELLAVLDEELQRLPEARRVPLVLCYLQGHTCEDAAAQLGWSLRTLKRRLEQGRRGLRARLARRGIALPAALLTLGLTQKGKAAAPAAWVAAAVQAALGRGAETAPTAARAIAEAVLRGMGTSRLRAIGALLLVGALIAGAGALAFRGQAEPPPSPPPALPAPVAKVPEPPAAPPPAPARDADEGKKVAVSGRVIGAYDRPLKGAHVVVYATVYFGILSGQSEEKVLGEVKTDGDGSFQLEAPEPAVGHYARRDVVVFAKGYGPAWQHVAANDPEPLTLQLSPERSTTGRLIDLQGGPAAGVKLRPVSVVRITAASRGRGIGRGGPAVMRGELPQRRFTFREDAAGQPATVTTDPSGRFRLDGFGSDQQVHLLVEDDRFARQEVVVPAERDQGDKELSVTLLPPRLFTGRIAAGDADKPVAGARVRVRVTDPQRNEGPIPTSQTAEGRTGADGRFSVNAYLGDQYFIEVFPPAGEPYLGTSKSAGWPRGTVKQEMNFTLARGVLVRGTVSEPGGKKPVGSAEVAVIAPGESRPRLPASVLYSLGQKHYTGTDGRFEVVAPIGTSHLVVTGPNPDYVYQTITEQELQTGKPGGDVRHFHAIVSLDLAAKDGPKEVKVELRRAVTVKGRVVGPDGKPVLSAELSVPSELAPQPEWRYLEQPLVEATRASTLMTRDDGTFVLPNCDPEKTYRVFFLDAGPLSGPTGPPGNVKDRFDALNRYLGPNHLGAVVEISPAKIGDKVLEVKLARCGSAEVRFVDAKGKPVRQRFRLQLLVTPGPSLRKSREEGKPAAQAQDLAILPADLPGYDAPFRADAEGWVHIPSLIPDATYRVQAMGVRYEVLFEKDFTVESGKTTKLELTLSEAK
jgi:RNA polymerase sigma factor (sigma-70 family)